MTRSSHRRGAAALWALVVLGFLMTLSMTAVSRLASARKTLALHEHRLQAEWLARSAFEIASVRLADDATNYKGETIQPIPQSEVQIAVSKDDKGLFHVKCEARYPATGKGMVLISQTRTLKRTVSGKEVKVEVVP